MTVFKAIAMRHLVDTGAVRTGELVHVAWSPGRGAYRHEGGLNWCILVLCKAAPTTTVRYKNQSLRGTQWNPAVRSPNY